MAEVLVVDDNADISRLIIAILSQAGHRVMTCASGSEMLRKLGLQPDDKTVRLPDLLIVDIMMPQVDGYAVCTAVRNNARTRDIPILIVSGLREMSRLFAATAPVDGFLTKPFTPDQLLASAAMALGKRKA